MHESSLKGFEKTETGYALSMDGLPDGELKFTLCSEETFGGAGIVVRVIIGLLLMVMIILSVKLAKKRRRI